MLQTLHVLAPKKDSMVPPSSDKNLCDDVLKVTCSIYKQFKYGYLLPKSKLEVFQGKSNVCYIL